MNPLLILLLFVALMFSCGSNKRRLSDLLQKTDRIRLVRITSDDTLTYDITDKRGIETFTAIIDSKQYNIKDSTKIGSIIYMIQGQTIFNIDIFNGGIRYVFNNELYTKKISYRAGMYFGEIWRN